MNTEVILEPIQDPYLRYGPHLYNILLSFDPNCPPSRELENRNHALLRAFGQGLRSAETYAPQFDPLWATNNELARLIARAEAEPINEAPRENPSHENYLFPRNGKRNSRRNRKHNRLVIPKAKQNLSNRHDREHHFRKLPAYQLLKDPRRRHLRLDYIRTSTHRLPLRS